MLQVFNVGMNRLMVVVGLMASVAQAGDLERFERALTEAQAEPWILEAAKPCFERERAKLKSAQVHVSEDLTYGGYVVDKCILAARAEQKQAAAAKVSAELDAYIGEHKEELLTTYFSWRRCSCQSDVAESMAIIDREKKKSKLTGIVNKGTLNEAGERVMDGKKCIEEEETHLSEIKANPLKCTNQSVTSVTECFGAMRGKPCEAMRRFASRDGIFQDPDAFQ